jgi:hypothetical protein
MVEPEAEAAAARRWSGFPEHARTPGQLVGRKSTGCEGTHGVFPACDFACKPCYHSRDANRVRVDGPHTIAAVEAQMAFLRAERSPTAYAQLIGGEVSLLDAEDHAAALAAMWAAGRVPMSMTHGDFSEDYLRRVVLGPQGRRRFPLVSFAAHIDTTMFGRGGAPKPQREADLHDHRAAFAAMFGRLRRDARLPAYLAHNMTVTPRNLGEVAEVIRACRTQGWRMFSFQPAAYVGDDRRWSEGFRTVTDDAVWAEVSRGAGHETLPYRAVQFGDLRCNRATWGAWVGDRYVPIVDENDPADLGARDLFFATVPGPVRGAGGWRALRHGVRPMTFAMHSFIDAALVAPAWTLLQRGETAADPDVAAAQERLAACVYTMGHPETGDLVPACVQHSLLDPEENRRLAVALPLPARRGAGPHPDTPS